MDALMKPYNWALDNRALVYKPSRQKYLCPQGHICYEINKEELKGYIYCNRCQYENPYPKMEGFRLNSNYGIYIPISNKEVNIIND